VRVLADDDGGIVLEKPVIFLDDGGVMNDNERRSTQWQRLVGEFFSPRLGGAIADWQRANFDVAGRQNGEFEASLREDPFLDPTALRWTMNERWLVEIADQLDLTLPSDRKVRNDLTEEATAFVVRRVHADYPGVVDAIEALHVAGYRLLTASGEFSTDLDGYLIAMGVRGRFGTLYGPDHVGVPKAGPHYYQRVFEHARVPPENALVVDDKEWIADWAASVGAQTVVCRPDPPVSSRHRRIKSLAELPGLLAGEAR
jgi:HAD superfamily hydrolase (TIGR01509 family)